MAHRTILGYSFDSLEYVEVDDVNSPSHNGVGSNSTQVPSLSSPSKFEAWASLIFGPSVSLDLESVKMESSISTTYYQCIYKDFLVECLNCGSFFDLGMYCLGY